MRRIELSIRGRVQGVSFRAYAQERALALGLAGLVRNRRDGSVELVAEGPPEALQAILDWSWQGSPLARVDQVESRFSEATGEYRDFDIAPTR